ncbi:MAG: tripartite tricarboxylate transporter substrate binding protein [Desulfomonile tiedjei]|uniref:Tripartite tricarboxylate transporter substrate binding protein n=1 Tax=Desulfomonile tiedjei TaxID=2358 RepID=A0A9D6V5D1_9BACT|nr:tripartite tricarboxylate transporter substrate binding protein [Desulfomonile tiedjei]
MKGWKWLAIVLVLIAMVGTSECAEKFPAGPITYIIPFNPGGQSDVEARLQQPYLEKILGVPIVVTYVPGAGGGLAWTKFAQAKPDGYSVCGINTPHIILQPLAQADVAFKTEDLKPLCMFESTPIGLAVKKDSKINSTKEFIEFAKANPGKVTVGMSGKLSGHHLAALQFMKLTGTKLTLVTFTGAAPQMTALLGGHVEAAFGNSSDLVTFKDQIKVLAIGSESRMNLLSNVPTFEEEGLKFAPRIDRGVAVPKSTPPEIAAKLEKAFLDTVKAQDYSSKIQAAGFVPLGLSSEQSIKYIAEQTELCTKLLADDNLLLKK